MSFTKKIVAFDIDDTLTASKQPLLESMALLLAELSKITQIVIISGGSIRQFKKQIIQTFIDVLPEPEKVFSRMVLLPVSGSQRYEYNIATKEWDMTDMEPFDEKIKIKALAALQHIVDSGEYDLPAEHFGERIEERGTQITLSTLGQDAPVDKKMAWDPDESKRKKIQIALQSMLPEAEVHVGGSTSIDILHKGFNKAVGLTRLLNKLGIQKEDMIFLGDAMYPDGNDYPAYEVGIDTVAVTNPQETADIIRQWLDTEELKG